MNCGTLQVVMKVRGLNQSDIARLSGVSRQAVSRWFLQKNPSVSSTILSQLSKGLEIPADLLLHPLPLLGDPANRKNMEVSVNWDFLFLTLEDYLVSLIRGDPKALARLVQTNGMHAAQKIVGNVIWKKFHVYKMHLRPQRREECERLWNLKKNLPLN